MMMITTRLIGASAGYIGYDDDDDDRPRRGNRRSRGSRSRDSSNDPDVSMDIILGLFTDPPK